MSNKKNDIKYHEILKQAAIFSYRGKNAKLPEGYKVIETAQNERNGFYADVLSNGKDVVIAYRGTEVNYKELQDLKSDIAMAKSKIPTQATDAIALYDRVKREHPKSDITITGHSLGGSLAEIVSGLRGGLAVTFNAYGVKDMFKSGTSLKENNVVNYVNEYDAVTMVNGENHIGEIYSVSKFQETPWKRHYIEYMDALSERKEKTVAEIKSTKDRLHPNSVKIAKAIKAPEKLKQKAVTEIGKQKKTRDKNHREFIHSNKSSSACVGSYPVSGYTRSDGTEVSSYVRTCGAKHAN